MEFFSERAIKWYNGSYFLLLFVQFKMDTGSDFPWNKKKLMSFQNPTDNLLG